MLFYLSDPNLYGTVSSLFPKVHYPVLHYVNRHYPITFKELFTVLAEDHRELTHIGKKGKESILTVLMCVCGTATSLMEVIEEACTVWLGCITLVLTEVTGQRLHLLLVSSMRTTA